MRLAVAEGPVPFDPALVDARVAAKIRDLGFGGVGAHFGYGMGAEPDQFEPAVWQRAREQLAAFDVRVVQSWAWNASLTWSSPDEGRRELRRLGGALRVAAALGADNVVIGSGGHNPRGPFWPDRRNHTREALDGLVRNLRDAALLAEEAGLTIALEAHVMTTLDSPEHAREVLDAVGSPAVRINADPVNFVGDLASLWDTTTLVERMFELLGSDVVSGHLKDVYAEDRLVMHLSETVPGDGEFDLRTYLRLFEASAPDAYLVIEHLPEALVPRAKRHLDGLLADLGIAVLGPVF